jgi:enoyl-CoA hydratase/carnithine racemase
VTAQAGRGDTARGATLVRADDQGTLTVLRLSDPGRKNALGPAMVSRLRQALSGADGKAIVLSGEGRHFCAGGDHAELHGLDQRAGAEFICDLTGLLADLAMSPVPVISAVHGAVVGGGVELILQTDFVVASEDAWFWLPQVSLGGRVGAATYRALLARTTTPWTRRFVLLGPRVSAAEALTAGLVDQVVPRADLESVASDTADTLAAQPEHALRRARAAIAAEIGCGDLLRADEKARATALGQPPASPGASDGQ